MQIHNEHHLQTSSLISVGEIYVITKTKNIHTFTFDRFCSIALKILKYLLFPQNSVLKTKFPHSFAITKY